MGFFIRIKSKGKYFSPRVSLVMTCISSINNYLKKKKKKREGKQHTLFDIFLTLLGLVDRFGVNSD